jgi:hypothetical protein
MSVQINISGTIIDFPSSAQSPNWAPALIEFAQTVAASLSGIVGPYDVSPQIIDIENDNGEHAIIAAGGGTPLAFPTSVVRAANIRYSVYRNNTASEDHAETGILSAVYNSSTLTWELQREFVGNVTPQGISGSGLTTSGINFRIDNNGQVYYTAKAINSVGYNGKLSFAAQALLQTS